MNADTVVLACCVSICGVPHVSVFVSVFVVCHVSVSVFVVCHMSQCQCLWCATCLSVCVSICGVPHVSVVLEGM